MLRKIVLVLFITLHVNPTLWAQTITNKQLLNQAALSHKKKELEAYENTLKLAKQKGWQLQVKTKEGALVVIAGVDPFGYPVYVAAENNITAAATTGASQLWDGGTLGLNLSGSSNYVKNKLAVWDEGTILNTHVEINGRVQQKDGITPLSEHSTHVAGTMIGLGINPLAKGMAYGAQSLLAYDFNNHISEIMSEAPGLLVSNHSYGTKAGWGYNTNRWEFYGRAEDNEDYKFGYYNSEAQLFDSIAYNAPYYLIVKSAGNNRGQTGPAVGQSYWRYNASGQMADAGLRPAGLSSNDGYDIIPTYGTAKNILTVGAVKGLPFGYNKTEDVIMSSFSSWGPTDDGRIKPDIVGDGVDVLSSVASADNAYGTLSGTSMASPNTAGSLLLLQEYYARLHGGTFMRSATLKALAIHTANEAGDAPGPDYKFGWGVLNVAKAADVITSQNTGSHFMYENTLNNGSTFTTTVVASGKGSLVATIVWTDPIGTVETVNTLNNRTKKLVNDLDIRIHKGTTLYRPWVLDPSNPSMPASTGDNVLDNVERINIDNAIPGETYTIEITHKGTLERGSQAYSLIVSGVGGQAYCTSAPTSNTGARIDSVSFGTIRKQNTAGCTTYANNTSTSTIVRPGQQLPITVALSSCDGTTADKIVKVYMDINNNGTFTDPGELLSTSGLISGNGTFSGTITLPQSLTPGNSSVMRVVAQQTSQESDVNPCGTYGSGETQDYKVTVGAPANDIAMLDITSPANACGTEPQYASVIVRNNGSSDKATILLKLIVKNGSTTVSSINETYQNTLGAGAVTSYTFQSALPLTAGTTYTIQAITADSSDVNRSNDTLTKTVTITAAGTVTGTAEICGTTANLQVSNGNNASNYYWYTSAASEQPIATGSYTTTSTIPANNTYYVGTGARGALGLTANSAFSNGGGYLNSTGTYIKYTSAVPVMLESVRMYSKNGGKIDFIVADITSENGTSYSYRAISTTTIDVYTTSSTSAPGTQAGYDATDNGAVYNMNILLPSGSHVIIIRMQDANTNLFRNNNVTGSPYPFAIPNVISFTGNSATSTTNTEYFQGFYYFLYDMKVRTVDCLSDKSPVLATLAPTPVISQVADSLVSSRDMGNQWYLNGNTIPGANGKSYKPTQSGSYTVAIITASGCLRTSAAVNYVFTAVPVVVDPQFNLQSVPNPNSGSFTVSFNATRKENIRVDLVSAYGQQVYTKTLSNFIGAYSEPMHLEHLAPGVYVLKVHYGDKVQYKKMVIE